MESRTEIRKDDEGIDGVLGPYRGQAVDEKGELLVGPSGINEMVTLYRTAVVLFDEFMDTGDEPDLKQFEACYDRVNAVLTPEYIEEFMRQIKDIGPAESEDFIAGEFASRLIIASYGNGHSEFAFKLERPRLENFCHEVNGTPDRPIKLALTGSFGNNACAMSSWLEVIARGDVAWDFGHSTDDSIFTVYGNSEIRFGGYSKRSNYTLHGNSKEHLGCNSKESEYHVHGRTGSCCGNQAERSRFVIEGYTGKDLGFMAKGSLFTLHGDVEGVASGKSAPERCTFSTPNRATLRKLVRMVPRGNRVAYINPKGKTEIVRDYAGY